MFPFFTLPFFTEVRTFVIAGSAVSTTSSVVSPTVQLGDLLVFHDYATGSAGGTPEVSYPSGFSIIEHLYTAGSARVILTYKIADGSEGGTVLYGMVGSRMRKMLGVIRATPILASASLLTPNGEITSGNPLPQSILGSGLVGPMVGVAAFSCNPLYGSVSNRISTETPDVELSAATSSYLHIYLKSNPIDITVDMDDCGANNCLMSCCFHSFS